MIPLEKFYKNSITCMFPNYPSSQMSIHKVGDTIDVRVVLVFIHCTIPNYQENILSDDIYYFTKKYIILEHGISRKIITVYSVYTLFLKLDQYTWIIPPKQTTTEFRILDTTFLSYTFNYYYKNEMIDIAVILWLSYFLYVRI